MTDAYVLGGARTAVGRYGGSLSHVRIDDLLGQTMVWACEQVGVDLDRIEPWDSRICQRSYCRRRHPDGSQ